jgi:hypothetical protein
MKNNLIFLAMVAFSATMTVTSCTKTDNTSDVQITTDFQKAIVGSWQIAEKGLGVAMHDGHICPDPENMSADKVTYVVQWEKAASDESRVFEQNRDYKSYVKSTLTCQGAYKISDFGLLEVQTNCENYVAKIEGLTKTALTVRQGSHFFKYQKLD